MNKLATYIYINVIALTLIVSCKKTSDVKNPYDNIDRTVNNNKIVPIIDSNSIVGLHTFIFAPKCAIPSCHGGPFEPDFRTPVSSYNTLVYQGVIKNDKTGKFKYRVIPYDTNMSWLHERLVTDDSILGRMPRYMPALSADEMRHVNNWIMSGAKDVNGVVAQKPNKNISLSYFFVYDKAYQRLDTARINAYYPFRVKNNVDMDIYFYAVDDETKAKDFLDIKVKFSTSESDFSKATTIIPIVDTVLSPGSAYFVVRTNSSNFTPNKQIYMRFYGRDVDHLGVTEFPNDITVGYYRSYYSFIVN